MLTAIETEYNGNLFRSRIEARWAVFFTELGIIYDYEKEGYNLSGVWYLPDFWIESWDSYFEVKGDVPDNEEVKKCNLLSKESGKQVLLAYGRCDKKDHRIIYFNGGDENSEFDDEIFTIVQCRRCPNIFLVNDYSGFSIGHPKAKEYMRNNQRHECVDRLPLMHLEVERSFDIAKAYRFEKF